MKNCTLLFCFAALTCVLTLQFENARNRHAAGMIGLALLAAAIVVAAVELWIRIQRED